MPKAKKLSRDKWLKRIAIAAIAYAVIGFLVLPLIIKWQMRKQLPELTHRSARVDSVRVNPFALSLTLRGVALTEPDGTTFASFSNFHVNFEPLSSLFGLSWTFKDVQLGSPYGYLAVLTNGQFNFSNLLTNSAPAEETNAPAKLPPPILVKSLKITNGVVAVADFYRPQPFQTRFEPIEVHLTNFTTRPRTGSPYAFMATTGEGEYFKWAGDVHAVPPASWGRFELGGIDLKKYGTYSREFTQLDVRDGKINLAATYRFALESNRLELTVTNASVVLTNLAVFAPGGSNALVAIPSVSVRGAQLDLISRVAKVASVETIGGEIHARRFRDGVLELLQLAGPPTNRPHTLLNRPITSGEAAAASTLPPATPMSVLVETVSVKDYTVRVTDEQPPRTANLVTDQINVTINGLTLTSNAPITLELSTRVNSNGMVALKSQGTLLPLAQETDLDVRMIELRPLQPYVEQQQVKLNFSSGNVSTTGRAQVALAGTNPPTVKFAGDVVLNDVHVVDQIAFQDFVRWKQVALRGIDFTLSPMEVKLRELFAQDFTSSVVVGSNKQLTALAVLPAKTNAPAQPAVTTRPHQSARSPLPFPLQLDLVALTNASVRFVDLSIEPHAQFAVQEFSGTVRGLSSKPGATAEVDIRGRMNESAPFAVAGKLNPLVSMDDLFVDLVISNKNTELTAFTPYMEKFAGHPLQKGKLSVGLKYSVQQKALEAQNVVFIDQLTLGPKNDNPDATKLPVKLGVALLKDRNGRIELDVPVKGRLDDPKFKVMPIVWQVVVNLLTKAATSPFSLLGALVGGGEELSYVDLVPGEAQIPSAEMVKIEKLGKALYERPALNLEIAGSADEALDRAALGWNKLQLQLKTARMAELAGKPDAPASADAVQLDAKEYTRLLKLAYRKTFNRDQPLPAVFTNAAGVVITNAPSVLRPGPRKGAEAQVARDARPSAKTTNVVTGVSPRETTRPAQLPGWAPDDEVLAQIEAELHGAIPVTASDIGALKQARAQSVQSALLKTEKVTADRLFILAPKASDAASKGQTRVNLSLN